jgi:hypothetical protein
LVTVSLNVILFGRNTHWNLVTICEQVYKRRDIAAVLVQRAEKNGYKAIVLTADVPRLGRREADIRNKWNIISLFYFYESMKNLLPSKFGINCFISYWRNELCLMLLKCDNFCRMVAPRLKNLEGLLSIEAGFVSGIFPNFWI